MAESPAAAPSKPPVRTFEVTKIDLLKLSNLNVTTSTFKAQLYLELTLRGGAADPDLNHNEALFPIVNGTPTFRPSARWFMEKLEFNNDTAPPKLLDTLIRTVRLLAIT